ncbi:hypothetical protein G7Z17_g1456 [Cylindrodendrum hubeiense]|uniref:Glycosyltransferase n=1 Tax=Cylindrodendrum hubeiense TaxID=595255 RepID=A0A9P5LM27_9HYPO|nr:hypothetical protein G7Z17_g1456 [Cylindrodendrum hubeiense]
MDNEAPRDQLVADIVIPERLLFAPTTFSRKRNHQVDEAPARLGPVQQAVDAHLNEVQHGEANRTFSIAISQPDLGDDDGDDGGPRRGSLSTTAEEPQYEEKQPEAGASHIQFANDEPSANTPRIRFAEDGPSANTSNLFNALNSYSIGAEASGESTYNGTEERDPHARISWFPRAKSSKPPQNTNNPRWSAVPPILAAPPPPPPAVPTSRAEKRRGRISSIAPPVMQRAGRRLSQAVRKSSIYATYDKAKTRGVELQRKRWAQIVFEYTFYLFLLCFTYFVLVGIPLWKGAVWWLYWAAKNKFTVAAGFTITLGIAALYAFAPLFLLFENDPVRHPNPNHDQTKDPNIRKTALLIPCYKSATIIGATLKAALKIFPPSQIFVIANGNSPTPLDETESICSQYGVTHLWSPIGSKIVAQFVGCYAAKDYEHVLLIDDDCTLPPNFPVVGHRLIDKVKSIGYTIKSIGPDGTKGNYCQQAQDFEYKISGVQRAFAGAIGSATFPHGAISLWDRQFLISVFHDHPGFSVSEDWFFGHSCRRLGGRIKMCSQVFVETVTPSAVFYASGEDRGGFGEMTIFKQRFLRWNFFFVNGIWYNLSYIIASWKLGWWEPGAKLFVLQEVYETLLYLFTPFILPITLMLHPALCGYLFAGTLGLYCLNSILFNEIHLRLKKERVSYMVLIFYYIPYKVVLTAVNVLSCYWAIFKYAKYFANRHPKVVEDENAVEIVLRLEDTTGQTVPVPGVLSSVLSQGRRMTVTTVITRMSVTGEDMNVPVPLLTESQLKEKYGARKGKGISVQFADMTTTPGAPQNRLSRLFGPETVVKPWKERLEEHRS